MQKEYVMMQLSSKYKPEKLHFFILYIPLFQEYNIQKTLLLFFQINFDLRVKCWKRDEHHQQTRVLMLRNVYAIQVT